MSVQEIAKCLFKKNWADNTEFNKALNAYKRLTPNQQVLVEVYGKRYS